MSDGERASKNEYNGARTLILEDVRGLCLTDLEGAVPNEHKLWLLLDQALSSLTDLGILHDDAKLDNFLLVSKVDRIIIVDLEQVDEISASQYPRNWIVQTNVDWLIRQYREHLDF